MTLKEFKINAGGNYLAQSCLLLLVPCSCVSFWMWQKYDLKVKKATSCILYLIIVHSTMLKLHFQRLWSRVLQVLLQQNCSHGSEKLYPPIDMLKSSKCLFEYVCAIIRIPTPHSSTGLVWFAVILVLGGIFFYFLFLMVKQMQSSNISLGSTVSMDGVQTLRLFLVYYFQILLYCVVLRRALVSAYGEVGFIYKAAAYREFISKAGKQTRPTGLEKF